MRLETVLPNGNSTNCTLKDVLLVPKLLYSLLSVSNAFYYIRKNNQIIYQGCEILNGENKLIAFATKVGILYLLNYYQRAQIVNSANKKSKERLWHRRFGHLGEQNLQNWQRKFGKVIQL